MKKILIVDDDNVIADLYAIKFRSAGYDVAAVYSVAEMNAQFASGLIPDVLLLDVIMPKMNGVEVVRMVMTTKSLDKMKIVLFSNLDYKDKIDPHIAARISAFCVKSDVVPSQVLKVIDDLLQNNSQVKTV